MYRAAEWVSVIPLERTPREFQELVRGARERGLKFNYLTPDRQVVKAAIEKGKQQIPGQQLELPGVGDKAREVNQKAVENRREKIAEIAKARDRKERARVRLAKIRVIAKAREEADRARAAGETAARRVALEFPTPDQLRRIESPTADRAKERETPETERDRVTREAAEKAVREFQGRLQSGPEPSADKPPEKTTPERETPEAARARVEQEAREQVLREFPFPVPDRPQERKTVEIGERPTPELNQAASVEREAERTAAEKAREAATQQREAEAREAERKQAELDQARDAAYREMLNQPQVPEHVRLALSHAQAPEAAVRTPPGQAPSVERGGTRGPETRGIERTR